MSHTVAFDHAVPLHHQVYLQLRREIADGLWEGKRLPGEVELADRYGVSVVTTRAALVRLVDDGWVERGRGRGTRVIAPPEVPPPPGPPLVSVGRHRLYGYTVLGAEVRTAPAEACRAFGVPVGTELWQCTRLRTFSGRPHSVTHNAQVVERGERHTAHRLATMPMTAIFAAEGVEVASLRRSASAARAPAGVAEPLGLTLSDPVLVTTFTVHGVDGELLEWVRIYLHPDEAAPQERLDLRAGTWSAAERA
jgi:GntR family transcriptional regulator